MRHQAIVRWAGSPALAFGVWFGFASAAAAQQDQPAPFPDAEKLPTIYNCHDLPKTADVELLKIQFAQHLNDLPGISFEGAHSFSLFFDQVNWTENEIKSGGFARFEGAGASYRMHRTGLRVTVGGVEYGFRCTPVG